MSMVNAFNRANYASIDPFLEDAGLVGLGTGFANPYVQNSALAMAVPTASSDSAEGVVLTLETSCKLAGPVLSGPAFFLLGWICDAYSRALLVISSVLPSGRVRPRAASHAVLVSAFDGLNRLTSETMPQGSVGLHV